MQATTHCCLTNTQSSMKRLPATMKDILWIVHVLAPTAVVCSHLAAAAAASGVAPSTTPVSAQRPGCNDTIVCGNVQIPYPFAISQDCAFPSANNSGDFTITCNHSFEPPKPFIGNIEVINISMADGQMVIRSLLASNCYNSANTTNSTVTVNFTFALPYLISPKSNEFVAIGCDASALLANNDPGNLKYFTGCISYCKSVDEAAMDGDDCVGLGCCKTGIVAKLDTMRVHWGDSNPIRPNYAWQYSPCIYGFMAKKGWYNFSRLDLYGQGNSSFRNRFEKETVPLVVDWAIRNGGPCLNESGILKGPACVSNNSTCVNATNGAGYLCHCTAGYTGNPYVHGGCTNIDDCANNNNPCGKYGTCKDTDGSYTCKCNFNRKRDGKGGCDQYVVPPYAIAAIATVPAVLLSCFTIIVLQSRKQRVLFNKNGGDILKSVGINIYTKAELKAITKSYSQRIGGGFFGDVYKGTIEDGGQTKHVAVKCTVTRKLARLRQSQLRRETTLHEQEEAWKHGFVKEITFQFQIKHPNVVRLIGCCLETDVPILVFEYVSNGSLRDKLHAADKHCYISLLQRLDIAIGSAQALAHIHSHGEYNHVHGDIKPANILLDENLEAKVSDFGSSKLLPVNKYVVDVATDGNYADPVYYKTGRFTVKSDVYSFGVVLLELITRKQSRYGENRSLPIDFEKSWKDQDQRWSMYDPDILSDDDPFPKKCVDMVGTIALECLNSDADKRPTMGEVVVELKKVKSIIAYGGSCLEGPIVVTW